MYVGATDGVGSRQTAVLSAADGTVSTTFDVGGPMALDTARGQLYVSTENGVVAVDTGSGQVLRTLPSVPAMTWRGGSNDFLPPAVVPDTGEVLVVDGPKVRLQVLAFRTVCVDNERSAPGIHQTILPMQLVFDKPQLNDAMITVVLLLSGKRTVVGYC